MNRKTLIQPFLALSAFALCALSTPSMSFAAEPSVSDSDTRTKALEERVKQLERRIADMEANDKKAPQPMPIPSQRFGIQQDDFNKLFEQMQRQMMEPNNDGFGLDFPGVPNRGMAHRGRKPALGVGVDEVSDELKKRFKNDIKEGAFVLSVYPSSPAEKAGLVMGDAITAFDDKPVTSPKTLIEAVKSSKPGSHEITLARHGELLKVKVDLGAQDAAENTNELLPLPENGSTSSRTELKVSALELPDALAKDLKLDDAQRTKMSGILAQHAKALSEEFSSTHASTHSFGFAVTGDVSELAKKHADLAAKDLAGVLSDEQLKKWNDYRNTNSSISFSQSTSTGNANVNVQKGTDDNNGGTVKF